MARILELDKTNKGFGKGIWYCVYVYALSMYMLLQGRFEVLNADFRSIADDS